LHQLQQFGDIRRLRRASPRVSSVAAMSALPPKADIVERDRHVRFVPIRDILHRGKIASLFRRQSTVKSVADLPIGAWYRSGNCRSQQLSCHAYNGGKHPVELAPSNLLNKIIRLQAYQSLGVASNTDSAYRPKADIAERN
jgi:hypothetical protein